MSTLALSALLGAIVSLAIGTSVFLRDRTRPQYIHFALLCSGLCLWLTMRFLAQVLQSGAFHWAALMVSTFLPLITLRFFHTFLASEGRVPRVDRSLKLATLYAIGVLIYSAVFQPLHEKETFRQIFGALVIAGVAVSLEHVARYYRAAKSRSEQVRILYLLGGGVVALFGAAAPPLGIVLTGAYLYFLSQSLFRYRLLDLTELLGRMVVLAVLSLTLSGFYGFLLGWVEGGPPGLFFFVTIIASIVILLLFEPLRTVVENAVNRWMFRLKYELQQKVIQLRHELANVIDIEELVQRTLDVLEDSQRITHAALYLLDREGAVYELAGAIGPSPVKKLDAVRRRPFVSRLKRHSYIAYETLERENVDAGRATDEQTAEIEEVIRSMDEMNASLALALSAGDHVLGILALKDDRLREAYSTDEIELLRGLAAQISVTLENSQAYGRMRERERLAALGEMAAGLAHEIRNPLGAIKGAAQLLTQPTNGKNQSTAAQAAQPTATNEEFLGIIVDEVNRLNHVVSQFLDYARPDRGERQPLDVNEVVNKTVQLLGQQQDADRVDIQLDLSENLPKVRVHAQQLLQVFLNLALNAVEAMEKQGGQLEISSRLRRGALRGEPASFLEVRFSDQGPGIAPNVLRNLFIPFYTTKDRGTGLGLPICHRIAENHGGAIEVRSQPGQGATFTVLLPIIEETTIRARKAPS